ncbi:TetR/AcrR family transcriptional regulator [Nocardia brasiliensis]|uniref:TetR/AcrR family transcriptional regulator n=1 Tax=Nocardia brasiliensis TaxID=37326 RepID=UPI003D8A8331
MTASSSPRVYSGQPVDDRRAHRRDQFVAAGLAVFGENGYRESSITAICKAAGLARAQFYEHFTNREELLRAVYDLVQSDARQAVAAAVTGTDGGDFVTRARAGVLAYAESVGNDPRRARVSYIESVGVSADFEQHRIDERRIWAEFLAAELRRALGPDFVPVGGYPTAATGFIGALMALVHQWSSTEPRESLDDLVEVLTRFLVSLATG